MEKYIELNRESWNRRTAVHLTSEFYDVEGFLNGKNTLKDIELNLLGDISNKKVLHLQCHFGQDSISLSRLGAKVTGVDFSDKAIESARILNEQTKTDAVFICCDIYDLPQHLDETFDIIFTSYGTIGWLPDLNKWAQIISRFLKTGGKFIFVEFHPVVWMFDDDFSKLAYDYFNYGAIYETEKGTYADKNADIELSYIMWNHSTSEVLNALIQHQMEILSFDEFDYSPYDCFKHTIEFENEKFRIKHLEKKFPMVFSLSAIKKN